jgi:hypothetical protein
MRDWVEWHEAYGDPASGVSARLPPDRCSPSARDNAGGILSP